ncbi:hypothetical protein [Blastococcus atacamensis]|nr:hypothetical protein [Blastococcus atacamensis]
MYKTQVLVLAVEARARRIDELLDDRLSAVPAPPGRRAGRGGRRVPAG